MSLSKFLQFVGQKILLKYLKCLGYFSVSIEKIIFLPSIIEYDKKKNFFFKCFFFFPAKREERLQMTMSKVVESVSKKRIAAHQKSLVFEICCDDKKGEDVEVPFVQYKLPPRQ